LPVSLRQRRIGAARLELEIRQIAKRYIALIGDGSQAIQPVPRGVIQHSLTLSTCSNKLLSSPRKRGSISICETWILAFAGRGGLGPMTVLRAGVSDTLNFLDTRPAGHDYTINFEDFKNADRLPDWLPGLLLYFYRNI
jgi:hypothetical protein